MFLSLGSPHRLLQTSTPVLQGSALECQSCWAQALFLSLTPEDDSGLWTSDLSQMVEQTVGIICPFPPRLGLQPAHGVQVHFSPPLPEDMSQDCAPSLNPTVPHRMLGIAHHTSLTMFRATLEGQEQSPLSFLSPAREVSGLYTLSLACMGLLAA